jgi:hypothetical protein
MASDPPDEADALLREAVRGFGQEAGPAGIAEVLGFLTALPEAGTVVGDYRLGPVVGQGGMGVVHQAEQISVPGRKVAVKLLRGAAGSALARQRFAREVEVIGRLDHPHIVPILSSAVHGEVPYYAMKFVDGRSLRDLVRDGALRGDWRRIATLVRDLAQALAHAHAHGVVHRDVKPGNVLVDGDGNAMLLDFGLASLAEGSDLTLSTDSLGTLDYMAPEQIERTVGPVDARTDVYGLGALLYECLCGRPPFGAPSRQATLARILRGEPLSPRAIEPQVPRDLATICGKALQPAPADRYATAAAMAADLEAFLAYRPIQARPRGLFATALLRVRRHRWAAAGIAAGILLLAAVVVHFAWLAPERAIAARLATVAGLVRERERVVRAADGLAVALRSGSERSPASGNGRTVAERERELRTLRSAASQLAVQIENLIEQCLSIAPTHRTARASQAELLATQLRELLAGGGVLLRAEAIARTQQRLQRADDGGRHAALLDARARLDVRCDRGPARVVLCPGREGDDGRFGFAAADAEAALDLGVAPCSAQVAEGSWLLLATLDGHEPIRLPLLLRRTAVAAPEEHRVDLRFVAAGALGEGYRQVHAGFGVVAEATVPGAVGDALVWHDGFAIAEQELRLADWWRWSGEPPTDEERQELAAFGPLLRAGRWDRVLHVLDRLNAREAACGSGAYVTLPTPAQWRRAGQGADGRPWPWGFVHDFAFSRNYWSTVDDRQALRFRDSPAEDVSPFGVRELAGSLRELCLPADALRRIGTKQFVLCGGSHYSVAAADVALANERTFLHNDPGADVGIRLVRLPLPAVPEGPSRLDLTALVADVLQLCAVRGPLCEVLPVGERARLQDGGLRIDGYGGSFSPELLLWHPLRASLPRVAFAVRFAMRNEPQHEHAERALAIALGTQPGHDAHDQRLELRVWRTGAQAAVGGRTLAEAAWPRASLAAVYDVAWAPSPEGATVVVAVDGAASARFAFALPPATPSVCRYFGVRLPTLVGMTAVVEALRVEER